MVNHGKFLAGNARRCSRVPRFVREQQFENGETWWNANWPILMQLLCRQLPNPQYGSSGGGDDHTNTYSIYIHGMDNYSDVLHCMQLIHNIMWDTDPPARGFRMQRANADVPAGCPAVCDLDLSKSIEFWILQEIQSIFCWNPCIVFLPIIPADTNGRATMISL